jgi:predicted RNA-binding protein YlqC (UPF0109 family)
MPPETLPQRAKRLLLDLIKGFTSDHSQVTVEEEVFGMSITLRAATGRDDFPRLIGSAGKTLWALQNTLRILGEKYECKITVIPKDQTPGPRKPLAPYVRAENWNGKPILDLLNETCRLILKDPFQLMVMENEEKGETHILIQTTTRDASIMKGEHEDKALHNIFFAIGKNHGRHIFITSDPVGSGDASKIVI